MFSKLVILVLLAATLGLYLKIVMVDEPSPTMAALPQASVQVVESQGPGAADTTSAGETSVDDQMQLIKQVFAPEISGK